METRAHPRFPNRAPALYSLALRVSLFIFVLGLASLGIGFTGESVQPAASAGPQSTTTQEHLRTSVWWPTKPAVSASGYAGSAACAKCHGDMVASQAKSQMAHTLTDASASAVLPGQAHGKYKSGAFTYTVQQKGDRWTQTVSDGTASRDAQLGWAIGSGDVGQSYLWEKDGSFIESRFNYFSKLHGFAPTPGRLHGAPLALAMADGRKVEGFEVRTCFACHSTVVPAAEPLDTRAIVPGIGCEACHGPGAAHIAAMQAGGGDGNLHIVNGKRMSPAKAVDMCGACHSTPWDARVAGAAGVQSVRLPAYRLEKSRCWGASGDARITCTACHDPHEPLERNAANYDHACLDCHVKKGEVQKASADRPGAACPVATSKCASCHMPKVELPEMHSSFTDHQIRIAKAGAPFPD